MLKDSDTCLWPPFGAMTRDRGLSLFILVHLCASVVSIKSFRLGSPQPPGADPYFCTVAGAYFMWTVLLLL